MYGPFTEKGLSPWILSYFHVSGPLLNRSTPSPSPHGKLPLNPQSSRTDGLRANAGGSGGWQRARGQIRDDGGGGATRLSCAISYSGSGGGGAALFSCAISYGGSVISYGGGSVAPLCGSRQRHPRGRLLLRCQAFQEASPETLIKYSNQDHVISFPYDWIRLRIIPSGSTNPIVLRY